MSRRFERHFWATVPAALLVLSVHSFSDAWHPPPSISQSGGADWTCQPERDYDLEDERDNLTFYVDTDGSMNADSGQDLDGGGNESYWEAADLTIKDVVNGWHANNDCGNGAAYKPEECDAVRGGIGFFGDDSDTGDGLLAYLNVQSGEEKDSDIDAAIDSEAAGTMGLPGIETITVPFDGPAKVDTFSCPPDGSVQTAQVTCPPNGGVQVDRIDCPADGVAQVHLFTMPPNGQAQISRVYGLPRATLTTYSVDIQGKIATWTSGALVPSYGEIATGLMNFINTDGTFVATPSLGASVLTGPYLYLTANAVGVAFSKTDVSNINDGVLDIATAIAGLPMVPAPGFEYKYKINGAGDVKFIQPGSNTQTEVADAMVLDLNGTTKPVTALRISPTVVQVTADAAGAAFTVAETDLGGITFIESVPNVVGLPGTPAAGYNFDIVLDGTTLTFTSNATTLAADVCAGLTTEINNSGKPVTATDYGTYLLVQADVVGASFTLTEGDMYINAFNQVPNGAGLPGTPGASYMYRTTMNGFNADYTDGGAPTQVEVCGNMTLAINALTASSRVTATEAAGVITLTDADPGAGFAYSTNYMPTAPLTANVPGLPGDPGRNHVYNIDIDFGAGTRTITYNSGASPTQATVCAGIAAQIAADPAVNATALGGIITVTPQQTGQWWNFPSFDANLTYSPGPASGALPYVPATYHNYDFNLNGSYITFTDDGSPTRAEICGGIAAAVNASPEPVGASCAAGVVTIMGTNASPIDINTVDGNLTHAVVEEAGRGPYAFGDVAERISSDLTIPERAQHAVVIAHRPPGIQADFWRAVDALCIARDRTPDPIVTHFIPMGFANANEVELFSALAAAGGSGSCSVDPCTRTTPFQRSTFLPASLIIPYVCSGSVNTTASGLKSRIKDIVTNNDLSCQFDLDVPASYPGGQAPPATWVTWVQVRRWENHNNSGDPPIPYGTSQWQLVNQLYYYHSWNWFDDSGWMQQQGWLWGEQDSGPLPRVVDRSKFTFASSAQGVTNSGYDPDAPYGGTAPYPSICDEIRNGNIRELRSQVACQCANQGLECTFTPDPLDPPLVCKSIIAGMADEPCSAEQLLAMRCTTGIYVCDNGVEKCTATGTNTMPEICNGIDDDCDGITDNMSNGVIADFAGEDPMGKNCGFQDVCSCPDAYPGDVPSVGQVVSDHLDSWLGECLCADSLEAAAYSEGEPALFPADEEAACSVGMNAPSSAFAVLTLLGMLGFTRRRRR